VVSSQDRMDWGIMCDPAQVADPWRLAGAIVDAQAELAATIAS
jgi:hypothetical protein